MAYQVKEIFYTLQGEGAQAGRPAVFCRFAGCNLWSGREADRHSAICKFCDTDFVGTDGTLGARYDHADSLALTIAYLWPQYASGQALGRPYVVFTGGEPLLQLDSQLIFRLQDLGFEVAVETNGTLPAPKELDWVCVSPKGATLHPDAPIPWVQKSGHELKLVWPQPDLHALPDLSDCHFTHYFLQPQDCSGPGLKENHLKNTLDLCLQNPQWHLSLQTHKIISIR